MKKLIRSFIITTVILTLTFSSVWATDGKVIDNSTDIEDESVVLNEVQRLEKIYSTDAIPLGNGAFLIPKEGLKTVQSSHHVSDLFQMMRSSNDWETAVGIIVKGYEVGSPGTASSVVVALSMNVRYRYHIQLPILAFVDVIDTSINMVQSGTDDWEQGSLSATIESDGHIHFLATGVVQRKLNWTAGAQIDLLKSVGFSASGGWTVTLRKFVQLSDSFDPMFNGGYWN